MHFLLREDRGAGMKEVKECRSCRRQDVKQNRDLQEIQEVQVQEGWIFRSTGEGGSEIAEGQKGKEYRSEGCASGGG